MTRAALPALVVLLTAAAAAAQPADHDLRPAFSLSTTQVFTTREAPAFHLTFRRVPSLDFRVYKVNDALAFFASLRDPHQLGSDTPIVAQERSWIERIADWKARQRRAIRSFFRGQVSPAYRARRRGATDRAAIAQRVTLSVTSFAQVPLLNPNQLVTAWREVLPDRRDPEYRRLPLDVREPGVYVVEAVRDVLRAYTVVIVSDVGLVTKAAPGQLVVFAADRFSGEPTPDCEVRVTAAGAQVAEGRTDGDGLLDLPLPEAPLDQIVAVARCGDQIAATDPGAWAVQGPTRELAAYVYTDKPIYRPGHTVHVKAVLRWRQQDALAPFDGRRVELTASDINDKVVFREALAVDAFGAVHASFRIPETAALGYYALRLTSGDAQATGAFEVQEYRRPEFDVAVTPAALFVRQGTEAVGTVRARYYFGQPVANGRLRWVVNQQPYYSPFRWDDGFEGGESTYWYGGEQRVEGEARLDANGAAEIRVPAPRDESGRDYSMRIEAQVTDASGREVVGRAVIHATYGSFLLAARTAQYVAAPGAPVDALIRAVDYEGAPQAGLDVRARLDRITYPRGYSADPTAETIASAAAQTAADGTATIRLTLPSSPGTFRITATAASGAVEVSDDTWLWVGGEDAAAVEGDRYLELVADRRTYAPGDTARLVVRGESLSGPVLVTKEGQQVTWRRLLRMSPTDTLDVGIDAGDVGDVYVNVVYLRDGRLHRAERRLSVPPADRALHIAVTPDQPTARPQDPATFTLTVTDTSGRPVEAQLSLAVIDEAVYGVKPDDTPDPLRVFYRREYSRVGTTFSREFYFVGYSGDERLQLAGRRRRPLTLADFKGDKDVQPQVRKDFPDAIYWIADLVTDMNGRARVALRYPDTLTTWRLTARAVTRDTRAGTTVARTTTTKDLIVRVTTPRFLTEGDEVVLPAIVHNYRDAARTATVSLDVEGLEATGQPARGTTSGIVEAGGERRDDWRYTARAPGTAVATARATTETDRDAIEVSFPVVPYGLRREAGASGSLAGPGERSVQLTVPPTANPAGRRIRVSLAPSLAGSMLGALDFLTSYPYGCTEQTLSSFLPNVLVTRALTELQILPTERLSALDRQVSQGLARLGDYQHEDGGWGWWKTDENHPFMTAYALFGLDEARRAGYRVEEYRLENGLRALARQYLEYPRAEPDLKAYLLYVLGRIAGDRASIDWWAEGRQRELSLASARDELWGARSRMSAHGQAFLLLALDAARDGRGGELARGLAAGARTAGDLAWWPADRDALLLDHADTSAEATAMVVQALARRDPRHPLLESAVRWLVVNRSGGYWRSTKQTAMALYGLLEYLRARHESPQPVTVDVLVNGAPAGSHRFTAASLTAPDPVVFEAPAVDGVNEVRLVTRGAGAVYWGAHAVYFDTAAADSRSGSRPLAIHRAYAKVVPVERDGRIVYREAPLDGPSAPGDVLSVRLVVAGSADWRYLVIEDPLPAGVEAIQDTTAYPLDRDTREWWWGSRVEYRDQKTVFFQQDLTSGRTEYRYLVKVTTTGVFRAVPAQVAPMYVPEVSASSDPATLAVTPGGPPR
ncbi:MAG: alpha-2-macroglobulin family protein [Acidobacteriota bacterium]